MLSYNSIIVVTCNIYFPGALLLQAAHSNVQSHSATDKCDELD